MAAFDDLRTKTRELLDEGLRTGALTAEEHSWRRGHLEGASTVEALEGLVTDLLDPPPIPGAPATLAARASQVCVMASRTFVPADLGRRSEVVTALGSSRFDLRGLAPGQSLTLELVTVMGDTTVEVPSGTRVRVDCSPVMGEVKVDPSLLSSEATVRISGVILMGSLNVVPSRRLFR